MPKGYSLHIGLNNLDPLHYGGWNGKLTACESDAKAMASIANSLGYKPISLFTKDATRDNVKKQIEKISTRIESGDIFFLSYSGHGGNLPDFNNDEDDAQDETWCLFDGQLIDDELYELWSLFEKDDVRIIVIPDCCHSGTPLKLLYYDLSNGNNMNDERNLVYKFMPSELCVNTYEDNKEFYDPILTKPYEKNITKCTVKSITACQDNQTALDGTFNGLFTSMLLKIWNNGKFDGTYEKFHKLICQDMPPSQTPNYYEIGRKNKEFDKQKPFLIETDNF